MFLLELFYGFVLRSPMLIIIELVRFVFVTSSAQRKSLRAKIAQFMFEGRRHGVQKHWKNSAMFHYSLKNIFGGKKFKSKKNFSGIFPRKIKTCMWKIYETKIDENFIMKTCIRFYAGVVEWRRRTKRNIHFSKAWLAKLCWNQEEKNDCKKASWFYLGISNQRRRFHVPPWKKLCFSTEWNSPWQSKSFLQYFIK